MDDFGKKVSLGGVITIILILLLASVGTSLTPTGTILPEARSTYTVSGEAYYEDGNIFSTDLQGSAALRFILVSQGVYSTGLDALIQFKDSKNESYTLSISDYMDLESKTLAPDGYEFISTEKIRSVRGISTCDVYEHTNEKTGDITKVFVSGEDCTVYSIEKEIMRFVYDSEMNGIPLLFKIKFDFKNSDGTRGEIIDDPSVGTSSSAELSGFGTVTENGISKKSNYTGKLTSTLLCVGSEEHYEKAITYYSIMVDSFDPNGKSIGSVNYLLGFFDDNTPQGGYIYAKDVEEKGRTCTVWTMTYSNFSTTNVEKRYAEDWASTLTLYIADDGSNEIVSYYVDQIFQTYTVTDAGKYILTSETEWYLNS